MVTVTRRSVLAGSAGLLASPAIIGRAAAATRGVTNTEIVIGMMSDLSGVTAVQGTNATNAIRMAFDDVNEKGGINGRKVHFIVEDMEYLVPKAVQAMNKLVNRDNIFLSLFSGGTPQMDAVLPMMLEKEVPSVFPSTCARSMSLAVQQAQIRAILQLLRSDALLREGTLPRPRARRSSVRCTRTPTSAKTSTLASLTRSK